MMDVVFIRLFYNDARQDLSFLQFCCPGAADKLPDRQDADVVAGA